MDAKEIVTSATEQVTGLTPSVIALAVAQGVAPKDFAKSLTSDATADFMVELTAELGRIALAEARKQNKSK